MQAATPAKSLILAEGLEMTPTPMEGQTAHGEECKLKEDMTGVVAATSTVFSAVLAALQHLLGGHCRNISLMT